MQVIHIPAFSDNYIWLIVHPHSTATTVVDPGDAQVVIERLQSLGLELHHILLTHHHADHVGGVATLQQQYPQVQVYAPAAFAGNYQAQVISEQQPFELDGLGQVQVIAQPGHTLSHVAYLIDNAVFVGDSLFSAGCGRMFEGDATSFWHSLQKLKQLPPETLIYCAHEYTQANLRFALACQPGNTDVVNYQRHVSKLRQQGLPTLPSTIGQECLINPFLRTDDALVQAMAQQFAQQPLTDEIAIFATIRAWKDQF